MNHHDISHFRGLKTKKDTHISRKEKKGVKMERLVINIIKKLLMNAFFQEAFEGDSSTYYRKE